MEVKKEGGERGRLDKLNGWEEEGGREGKRQKGRN